MVNQVEVRDGTGRERAGADLVPVAVAAGLVVVAAVAGALLSRSGVPVHASAAPLFARFRPHLGPGTVPALAVAALVVGYGPGVARHRRWGVALTAAAAAGLAWTVSLALVGGSDGILGPLATQFEYLSDVPRVSSLPEFFSTYTASIPDGSPMPWHTHSAGHPPGMLLVFVLLDRIGLGGPGPAAALCLAAAALTGPLVAIAARSVCGEETARRAMPFLVLTPAAIWAGVSADAVIAAVGALGLLLLARAVTADRPTGPALGAGAVLGLVCFLSYGGGLLAVPALLLLAALGRWRLVPAVAAGGLVVVGLFTLAGFRWWEGFAAVHERYLAGYGGTRPYAYWSWADLAVLAIAAGPAVVAGLARLGSPGEGAPRGVRALAGGALAAVLLAAVSGMSKGEVERIWLPWTVWLPLACTLLPGSRVRWWLAGQAAVALAVEHLLLTPW